MYRLFRLVIHLLFVTALAALPGAHAQESPVAGVKTRHLFTIESDFNQPSDVVAGNNGRIYVLDGVNDRVKVFDKSGALLFSFGETGSAAGKFSFPLGIGIDDDGRIYVADSGNRRVQLFSPDGTYLSEFTTETGQEQIKPSDPTDVVVNTALQRCYVVDNDNHRVIVYDLREKKITAVSGTMGMEKKEFRFPFLLDRDREGNLYIVEVINTRVKVLDAEGNYLGNIGGWGVDKGKFYRPKGVAVDSRNRVFVSDSYLGVIQVFDQQGRFLSVLGDGDGKIRSFRTPAGIFIDKQLRLYVVEMLADRVTVLQVQD